MDRPRSQTRIDSFVFGIWKMSYNFWEFRRKKWQQINSSQTFWNMTILHELFLTYMLSDSVIKTPNGSHRSRAWNMNKHSQSVCDSTDNNIIYTLLLPFWNMTISFMEIWQKCYPWNISYVWFSHKIHLYRYNIITEVDR